MALREQNKLSVSQIAPGVHLNLNPYAQTIGSARVLVDFIPEKGRVLAKAWEPLFADNPAGNQVWNIFNYRYTRNGAQETKLVVFRSNGRIYVRRSSWEEEIFPGVTSFSALTKRPFVGQLNNRLFFSDGISSYVYDGRSIRVWGLARTASAPATSTTGTGITASTGLKAAVTWVVLDEASNRVHESSRSNVAAFLVLANQGIRIDITGMSAPSGATHWSAYVSELDGSDVLRRAATTSVNTLTTDVTTLPASTSPEAPVRNDPPPPSTVGFVAKNRIWLRDEANPATYYFSALGEVKGLLNGAPEESFPSYGTNSISDLQNQDFVPDREIRSIIEHEGLIFLFSERRGYALVGELNLLDNRAGRGLTKLQQFTVGCAGANSIASTPYGLAWVTPGRKLYLWGSGSELYDIGDLIQPVLDYAPTKNLAYAFLRWHEENGRQWLILNADIPGLPFNRAQPISTGFKTVVYDLALPSPRGDRQQPDPGTWMFWQGASGGTATTCSGTFADTDGTEFMLLGDVGGDIRQCDGITQPTHLNFSFILGQTHLGTSTPTQPPPHIRTGLLMPAGDTEVTGQYVSLVLGNQQKPKLLSAGFLPTITLWIDPQDPDQPGTGVAQSLDSVSPTEQRAWLKPEDSGNTNISGAYGRQFLLDLTDTSVLVTLETNASRNTYSVLGIYKMALTWQPHHGIER